MGAALNVDGGVGDAGSDYGLGLGVDYWAGFELDFVVAFEFNVVFDCGGHVWFWSGF